MIKEQTFKWDEIDLGNKIKMNTHTHTHTSIYGLKNRRIQSSWSKKNKNNGDYEIGEFLQWPLDIPICLYVSLLEIEMSLHGIY